MEKCSNSRPTSSEIHRIHYPSKQLTIHNKKIPKGHQIMSQKFQQSLKQEKALLFLTSSNYEREIQFRHYWWKNEQIRNRWYVWRMKTKSKSKMITNGSNLNCRVNETNLKYEQISNPKTRWLLYFELPCKSQANSKMRCVNEFRIAEWGRPVLNRKWERSSRRRLKKLGILEGFMTSCYQIFLLY